MYKIVVSKQADYDSDIFKFWLWWYTKVYRADKIIITPIKAKDSSIEKTIAFYEKYENKYNIEIKPFYLKGGKWSDHEIWHGHQMKLIREAVSGEKKFFAISADSDQFFERYPEIFKNVGYYLFYNIATNREANSVESSDHIKVAGMNQTSKYRYVGGFLNGMSSDVYPTGHVPSPPKKELSGIPNCFHWYIRGFKQFRNKVEYCQFYLDRLEKVFGKGKTLKEYFALHFSDKINKFEEPSSIVFCEKSPNDTRVDNFYKHLSKFLEEEHHVIGLS